MEILQFIDTIKEFNSLGFDIKMSFPDYDYKKNEFIIIDSDGEEYRAKNLSDIYIRIVKDLRDILSEEKYKTSDEEYFLKKLDREVL